MRIVNTAAALLALPMLACGMSGDDATDEGWLPDGKEDHNSVRLDYNSYEVLFTNPLCREYSYPAPVQTVDGTATLTAKPKNVYCSHEDIASSGARTTSPQYRLIGWVRELGQGDEIFLAFLSFSNSAMVTELCAAAQRGTKVTFVLDAESSASQQLASCGGTILLRGHSGKIGYAHNKVVLINPRGSSEFMRMTFSSGNMSSGVVTHHENWHFIEAARDSYFAQAHVCLMDAQLSTSATSDRGPYTTALNNCRSKIQAPEETDIKAFFVPNYNDSERAQRYMLNAISYARKIDMGVHRFAHSGMVDALRDGLASGKLSRVRLVADDDLYWLDPAVGDPVKVGDNEDFEADNVRWLEQAGGTRFEARYMETNHGVHLLHHNKYLLYRNYNGDITAMLGGAANLTGTGFNSNFENIYFIKIPSVLEQFDRQYDRVWDGQKASPDEQDPPKATPVGKMPVQDVAGL